MFTILARGERYLVNDAGEITRKACDWQYSGQWKALALIRRNNFGRVVEAIPFAAWPTEIPRLSSMPDGDGWYYKNGGNKWSVRDLDHGTVRDWGGSPANPVDRIYVGDLATH